jgi:2-polyprenyl-3-methyl-5-hydroxy-6-metoxy-1,4-benzoquinol methylase
LSATAASEALPGRTLEAVACNLCGGTTTAPFTRKDGLDVVRCTACGLVYVNPRARAADLTEHYNSGESSRVEYYRDAAVADRRTFREILAIATRLAPARGTLLDVGPCTGTLLLQAREAGFAVQGIEINAGAARMCREELGLDVRAGVLEADSYPAESFDVVSMGDVIEHVPDPVATLRTVARVLKPGGHVLISTPNVESAAARMLQVKPEEHIYYFSAATLAASLEKAGLQTVEMRTLDRYRNFTAMTHSTTCGTLFRTLGPAFRLARRVLGDVVLRLPLRENLLAIARKP